MKTLTFIPVVAVGNRAGVWKPGTWAKRSNDRIFGIDAESFV
jgi:hypothetical protein